MVADMAFLLYPNKKPRRICLRDSTLKASHSSTRTASTEHCFRVRMRSLNAAEANGTPPGHEQQTFWARKSKDEYKEM
eukprot:scaffold20604_cov20-Tisochrysis_lutea.AAC.5